MRKLGMFAAVVLLSAALTGPVQGQVLYGSIVGTIEDPSGAAVPAAGIVLTNTETGLKRELKADEQGRYTVVSVLPGNYEMVVTAAGFRTLTRKGVLVTINNVTRVEARLEVGQVSERVTVEATAAALQTDRSDTRAEFSNKTVEIGRASCRERV